VYKSLKEPESQLYRGKVGGHRHLIGKNAGQGEILDGKCEKREVGGVVGKAKGDYHESGREGGRELKQQGEAQENNEEGAKAGLRRGGGLEEVRSAGASRGRVGCWFMVVQWDPVIKKN